jgi:hypothetical protein
MVYDPSLKRITSQIFSGHAICIWKKSSDLCAAFNLSIEVFACVGFAYSPFLMLGQIEDFESLGYRGLRLIT